MCPGLVHQPEGLSQMFYKQGINKEERIGEGTRGATGRQPHQGHLARISGSGLQALYGFQYVRILFMLIRKCQHRLQSLNCRCHFYGIHCVGVLALGNGLQ